ncbi:MAG: flagellar biosynthetic protein FliR [Syntrophobacteraceae bacterium]
MVKINIDPAEIAIFLSVLLRLSIIFFMLPLFRARNLPTNVKVCTIIALSFMLFPLIRQSIQPLPLNYPAQVFEIVVGELVFGVVFSLSMRLVISAFQFAGELISFEMGFGFSQASDPQTGAQNPVVSVWAELLAMMILFSINGHHILLRLIIESFGNVPVGSFALDSGIFGKIILLAGKLFVLALKLSSPIIAVLMLTQLGLGLMSKFAPQINILTTSFPLTIAIGIFFLGLLTLVWGDLARKSFAELFHFLGHLA